MKKLLLIIAIILIAINCKSQLLISEQRPVSQYENIVKLDSNDKYSVEIDSLGVVVKYSKFKTDTIVSCPTRDTIKVMLLYSDTTIYKSISRYSTLDTAGNYTKLLDIRNTGIFWVFGYEVLEKRSRYEDGVKDSNGMVIHLPNWSHVKYLNDQKKEWNKNFVIWQTIDIK